MKSSPAKSPLFLLLALVMVVACGWALYSGPNAAIDGSTAAPRTETVEAALAQVHENRLETGSGRTSSLPAYHAPVGSRLTYRLVNRTGWTMDARAQLDGADDVVVKPTTQALEQAMTMRGRMIMTVAARRGDEVIARLEFEEFALELPQGVRSPGVERLRRATEAPTLVRMKDTGEVLGYRFPEGLVASQCDMIRGLVTSFHVVVPDPTAQQWQRESTDSAGRFLAEYRRESASRPRSLVVTRTKLRYVASATPDARCPTCEGHGRATIGRDLGWLTSAEIDEKLVQTMQGVGGEFRVTVRGSLDLVASDRADLVPLPDGEFDGVWAGLMASPEQLAAEAEGDERRSWERVLRETTFDQLLAELSRLIANKAIDTPDAQGVVEALSWLVRVREETLEEVEAAIRRSAASGDLNTMLMWALAKAGSPAAQDVLVSFLADMAAPERRESAAIAMMQLAEPGEAVMGVLRHQVVAAEGAGRGDRMSLLLFGTLAPRDRAATPAKESALQTLLAQEKRMIARGLLPTWLEALGNAGTAAVAPRAIHYLTHDRADVRRSATSALRDVHTVPVRAALLRVARGDADPSVRGSALESLRGHDLRSARGQLREIVLGDRSPDVRRAALLLHAAAPQDPQTATLLRRVAKSDAEPALRELAGRLLAGGR